MPSALLISFYQLCSTSVK